MNWKQYLGNMLVNEFQMNRGAIPPDRYIKNDIRLVKRDKGTFATDLGENGEHGDTFDAIKLALQALRRGGAFEAFESANPRGIPRGNMGDLTATRTQMAEYDSELDPEYRTQILEALEAVESVLSQEDPKSKVGDPAALRAASAHLDAPEAVANAVKELLAKPA
jgi:hypothetical protein